jgi:hypothetical protein
MLKRLFLILFPISILFLSLAPLAQALMLYRDSLGQIMVYQGSILGETNRPEKVNNDSMQEASKDSQDQIEEKYLIRRYSATDNKQVKIQSGLQNNLEAQVQVKNQGEDNRIRTMEMTENIEAEQIRLRVEQAAEEGESNKRQDAGDDLDDSPAFKELLIEKAGNQFKLNSNGATAYTGAQFILEQDTGLVSIVTPSGNTHELKHFPDEAMAVMQAKGKMSFLADDNQVPTTDNYEMELTQNDEGQVVYRARVRAQKKLLGLIPWEFEQELELNDSTGEVTLEQRPSLISQLLLTFSKQE